MPTYKQNNTTPEYLLYIIVFILIKCGYTNVLACNKKAANADDARELTIRLCPTCNFKNIRKNATDPRTTKGLLYAIGNHIQILPVKY